MKNNRIIWGLVSLIVLLTIGVLFGTKSGHSQQDTSKKQDDRGYKDLSKYAIADYDMPESATAIEREERKLKNKRYDNQDWVVKNPHPDTSGVGRFDEQIPPPVMPIAESDLVIVGKIIKVSAHLSNDKSGVYSEFEIRINQILKNDDFKKVEQEKSVTTDRAGGFVRYPNGQKVFYELSERSLPHVGSNYVFFLRRDKESPNYEIVTLYELKDSGVNRLDHGRSFEDFEKVSKRGFVEAVRNKISDFEASQESRRKP